MRWKTKLLQAGCVILPLLLGLFIYLLYRPEAIVTKWVAEVLHLRFSTRTPVQNWERLLCNYGADVLWACAFSLYGVFWRNTCHSRWRTVFILCFAVELAVELFQLTPYIKATFDVLDIAVEFAVTAVILLIAMKIQKRRDNEAEPPPP